MIIPRQKSFSDDPEQREFNSKVAKALNNKYLKEVAARNKVPVYKSEGFKTVEIDPKTWKNKARGESDYETSIKFHNNKERFNRFINYKSGYPNASSDLINEDKKLLKKYHKTEYDHGVDKDFINDIADRKFLVTRAKKERLAKNK